MKEKERGRFLETLQFDEKGLIPAVIQDASSEEVLTLCYMNREALEKTAAMWREQFNAPEITADSIICDGCPTTDGRLSGYCSICEIRACAVGRGVETCAPCAEYGGCAKLVAFHEHSPEAKATLDGLRAAL